MNLDLDFWVLTNVISSQVVYRKERINHPIGFQIIPY